MLFQHALTHWITHMQSAEFANRIHEEDPRMIKLLPILLAINKCGFLTMESQSGAMQTGKYGQIHERAYCAGFMLITQAVQFIKYFSTETDKNVIVHAITKSYSHMLPTLDIPLTTQYTPAGKLARIVTHLSSYLPNSVLSQYKKTAQLSNSDNTIVYLTCWDSTWNRNATSKLGLFTQILHYLSAVADSV